MGYYTRHKLGIVDKGKESIDYLLCKGEISDISGFGTPVFEGSIKWHNHEEDMREFSKRYPTAVFCLTGEGQDNWDLWREYYKNGKMQRCDVRIVFDEFDESLLE